MTRLSELLQHCQFVLQQQTDQRLRQLTVLSAIFMPLTLITGVYGMNFAYMRNGLAIRLLCNAGGHGLARHFPVDYPQTERLIPVRPAGGIRLGAASV